MENNSIDQLRKLLPRTAGTAGSTPANSSKQEPSTEDKAGANADLFLRSALRHRDAGVPLTPGTESAMQIANSADSLVLYYNAKRVEDGEFVTPRVRVNTVGMDVVGEFNSSDYDQDKAMSIAFAIGTAGQMGLDGHPVHRDGVSSIKIRQADQVLLMGEYAHSAYTMSQVRSKNGQFVWVPETRKNFTRNDDGTSKFAGIRYKHSNELCSLTSTSLAIAVAMQVPLEMTLRNIAPVFTAAGKRLWILYVTGINTIPEGEDEAQNIWPQSNVINLALKTAKMGPYVADPSDPRKRFIPEIDAEGNVKVNPDGTPVRAMTTGNTRRLARSLRA
jgi:hypothetical protein